MIVDNKELITVTAYLEDIDKKYQSVRRYLISGRPLPGIEEYYFLHPHTFILKKAKDYRIVTKRVRTQKFLFNEK